MHQGTPRCRHRECQTRAEVLPCEFGENTRVPAFAFASCFSPAKNAGYNPYYGSTVTDNMQKEFEMKSCVKNQTGVGRGHSNGEDTALTMSFAYFNLYLGL